MKLLKPAQRDKWSKLAGEPVPTELLVNIRLEVGKKIDEIDFGQPPKDANFVPPCLLEFPSESLEI